MKSLAQWDQEFANALQEKCPQGERHRAGVFLSVVPNRQVWNEFLASAQAQAKFWSSHQEMFPHALLLLYAGLAFYEYDDNVFWPAFSRCLRLPPLPGSQQHVWNCAFEKAVLRGEFRFFNENYVGSAVYLVGIPLSMWEGFLTICQWALWKSDWASLSDQDWQDTMQRRLGGHRRLIRFLTENRKPTASEFIREMLDARKILTEDNTAKISTIAQASILRREYFEEVPETADFLRPQDPDSLLDDKPRLLWREKRVGIHLPPLPDNAGEWECFGERTATADVAGEMPLNGKALPSASRERETVLHNLWVGEALSYFGIPDSARESAEDLGLVSVSYRVGDNERTAFQNLMVRHKIDAPAADSALQVLLSYIRKTKAFTLPDGVNPDDPAFGRVRAVISFGEKADSQNNIRGWLPQLRADGGYRHNAITSFLSRLTGLDDKAVLELAREVWVFLTGKGLLFHLEQGDAWQLDHERLVVCKAHTRNECSRCGFVTEYSANKCCHRKNCDGQLEAKPFQPEAANLVARWIAGMATPVFTTLKSEEHTAQINKEVARRVEEDFRADGVNLLSSTTTFEMGINIGDLQKILLRNAPPTSASYVQRVGRAGRGKDKNSVCVTVCRRTKYDADAWREPERLMSGTIRPPTVFLKNRLIAQRHFNAVVFARFLRVKLCDEGVLGPLTGQKVALEPLLPSALRERITPAARKYDVSVSLGFTEWMAGQAASGFFATNHCEQILSATGGFDAAKRDCQRMFETALKKITDELEALLEEYKNVLQKFGASAAVSIEDAITNLLHADVIAELALQGFLPRYAFPLDVTTLETSFSRWQKDSDVELSRDRAIAISEFAPGAQVVARKQVFTSEGLYIVGKSDKPERKYYARCESCDQVRVSPTKAPLETSCPVCQEPQTHIRIAPFVEPSVFSIRLDKTKKPLFRKAVLLRQRQPLTHFTDRIEDSQFVPHDLFTLALKKDGSLFRYNLGPRNEGFVLCPACGCSKPKREFRPGQQHKRLRPYARNMNCTNANLYGTTGVGIAYGHEFHSFCLIVRPSKQPESVESLMFALQKGLCQVLELDNSDIGVSRRWLNKRTAENAGIEIVLYDRTPGGAGFVEEGKNRWDEVVVAARSLCEESSTHKCDSACYDCMKDFGNQQYHDMLDRNTVLRFFK